MASFNDGDRKNPCVHCKREVPCFSDVYAGSKCRNLDLIALVSHCDYLSNINAGKFNDYGCYWFYTETINQWVKRLDITDHQHHVARMVCLHQDLERVMILQLKMTTRPSPILQ